MGSEMCIRDSFEPVRAENDPTYNRPAASSQTHQPTYDTYYTQPEDPYSTNTYNTSYQNQYDTQSDNRPRQYFPDQPRNIGHSGSDYITRNEMLEDENQRLRHENTTLQNQKDKDDEEFNDLQDDYTKKDNLYKTFLFTTMLAAFISIVLLFWHPLESPENASKDNEITQLQTKVDELTKERDEAVKNNGDTNTQVKDLQKQLDDERGRADEAERHNKNLQSDLDRAIKERDEAIADVEKSSTPTTVTETQIVTVPDDSSSSNGRGNSNSNSASDALNSLFNN